MDFIALLRGIVGIILILGIAFLLSNNKKNINWRLVGGGFFLQIIFAVLIIKGEYLTNFICAIWMAERFF